MEPIVVVSISGLLPLRCSSCSVVDIQCSSLRAISTRSKGRETKGENRREDRREK
jgi:hypothetical protein